MAMVVPAQAGQHSARIVVSATATADAHVDFGDASAAIEIRLAPSATLEHVYPRAGTYEVTVTATSDLGASVSTSGTVTVP
jgi:hypothetical protein